MFYFDGPFSVFWNELNINDGKVVTNMNGVKTWKLYRLKKKKENIQAFMLRVLESTGSWTVKS